MNKVVTNKVPINKLPINKVAKSNADSQPDWSVLQEKWCYAFGNPDVRGVVKRSPADFVVIENMEVELTGEGEHVWLLISKEKQNTEQVAKALARHANVAYRNVGYSGMKDYFAVTQQWFSVWLPSQDEPVWQDFEMSGVSIMEVVRHQRKIKRGTHKNNDFQITIHELEGDVDELERRLATIAELGVPNYFGEQRFGREFNNMRLAYEHLVLGKPIKNRSLKSIVLSSARSWLFNEVISARINNQSWQILHPKESANLNGSNSCFQPSDEDAQTLKVRLETLDIHPTAPMWGRKNKVEGTRQDENQIEAGVGGEVSAQGKFNSDDNTKMLGAKTAKASSLDEFELSILNPYANLMAGLERAGLEYQRRALRIKIDNLRWQRHEKKLDLSFSLQRGQYATSVLRELIRNQVP